MDFIPPKRDENLLEYLDRNLKVEEVLDIMTFLKNFIDGKDFLCIFGGTKVPSKNQIPFFPVNTLRNTASNQNIEYGINFVFWNTPNQKYKNKIDGDTIYNNMSTINQKVKPSIKNSVTFKSIPGVISVFYEKNSIAVKPLNSKNNDTVNIDVYTVLVFIPEQINRLKTLQEIEEAAGRMGPAGNSISREERRKDMRRFVNDPNYDLKY